MRSFLKRSQRSIRELGLWLMTGVGMALAIPACAQDSAPASQDPMRAGTVTITADLSKAIGPAKPIYAWFGYDEANYTTAPNGRALLRELHDLSPVPVYIRAHHLLTSGDGTPELKWSSTGVYREDAQGKPVYDFAILDGIFDAYRDAGVRPMVEFGFMPKDLAATVPGRDTYQVHYPASTLSGASNNPPKDYAKWGELVRAVTAHLVQRYGHETVRQWWFEVWNEPDIDYWHGTPQDYWRLYDFAVAGVRSALPEARVGGPATTGPSDAHAREYLKGFLDHVTTGRSAANGQAVPLDFISFHAKGSPKIVDGHVTMGITHELRDTDAGFAVVASYPGLRKLPIILSEADPEGCAACSSRVNPANNYRNGTLYPAYTAAAYKALFDLQDRHGVNLISMLSWSFEFEGKDYFEGFRSLATNGIDKPVLNLFRMLGEMGGTRVATASSAAVPLDAMLQSGIRGDVPDVDAMATRAGHSAAVLLWNYHDAAEGRGGAQVRLTVRGLPPGVPQVRMEEQRIDSTHSNAYTAWLAMGSPQHPTDQQLATLKAAAGLQAMGPPQALDVKNGTVQIPANLPAQSVALIRLSW